MDERPTKRSIVNKESKTNNELKTSQINAEKNLETPCKVSSEEIKPLLKLVARYVNKRKRRSKI